MGKIWLAFIIFATYGSLWPFQFVYRPLEPGMLLGLLPAADHAYGLRDLVSNILLFIPIGIFGVLDPDRRFVPATRIAIVIAVGLILAILLQIAQIFAHGRQPDLNDVVWNGAGIGIGILCASMLSRSAPRHYLQALDLPLVPTIILGAWAAHKLARFFPSLKIATLIEGVQPLLDLEPISLIAVAHDATAWLIVAVILRHLAPSRGRIDRFLAGIIMGSFVMEITIERNVVTPSDLVAASIAIVAWHGWLGRREDGLRLVLVVLAGFLLLDGLWPMALRADPVPFGWRPFMYVLQLNPMPAFLAMTDQLFLFGSLVYLIRHTARAPWRAIAVALAALALLQVAQRWIEGHHPDLGALVMLLGLAIAFALLDRPPREDMVRDVPQAHALFSQADPLTNAAAAGTPSSLSEPLCEIPAGKIFVRLQRTI